MRKRLTIITFFISLIILGLNVNTTYFLAPMMDAMNPEIIIAGTNENEINCNTPNNNNQFTFEVDYTDTRSTERYRMESIPFAPEIDFNNISELGTAVNFSNSDEFSSEINFFPFSFFDETTSSLAIGENGVISLDPLQANQINLRYPSADIPNSSLTRNSIFASHYDLRIADNNSANVYYKIIGTYPARKLVITYVNALVFYCRDERTTSVQVVLEELTNRIQIHIKDKASSCAAITNAVVGIQDKYGNLGYSPSGRNYSDGDWTANNESYEFIPDGDRVPEISWIEGAYAANDPNNNIISTNEQVTVNADLTNLAYTVEVRYPNYRNQLGDIVNLILTDDIQVSLNYPIGLDEHVVTCDLTVNLNDYNDFVSLNPASNFTITYYLDQALTTPVPNPTAFLLTNANTTLYVKIAYDNTCFDVSTLEISSIAGFLQIDPNNLELYVCDNVDGTNPRGQENNYSLDELNNLLFGNIPNGEISYYNSANSTVALTSVDITEGTQIWVDILVEGSNGCRTPKIGPITLHFYEVPEFVSIPNNLELVACDKNFDYTEPFRNGTSWQSFLAENGLVTNDPNHTISVYETEIDAINQSNALTEITMDINDPTYDINDNSREAHLYIRIEDSNGCFSIKEFFTRIRFYGVDAERTPMFNLCVSEGTTMPIDLSCFLTDADFNGDGNFSEGMFNQIYFEDGNTSNNINDVYAISYHATMSDAQANIRPIDPNQTLGVSDVGFRYFYVRFTLCESCTSENDDCYTVKPIQFRVTSTKPTNTTVDVCHDNNGDTYVPNLNIFNLQIFDYPNSYTINYYESESDALNQTNEITEYNFTGDNYLWIRVISNLRFRDTSCFANTISPCVGVYRIRFVYGAVVEPINFPAQQIDNICDNNGDGSELFDITIFEDSIYDGDATFEYFANMNETTLALSGPISDPTQVLFEGDNGSATRDIFIKLNYADNSCHAIIRISITLNFLPTIDTNPGFLCSCLPNPGEYSTYDLTEAVSEMFADSNQNNSNSLSDMIISYHNYYNDAIDGTNEILNSSNYQSIRGNEAIFVRFYSRESSCYSVDTLTLKNLVLPVPIPGSIQVCDTNINGDYDIILSDLNEIVMPGNTDDYYFSYFWTYEDAENNVNPITDTDDAEEAIDFFYEFNTIPSTIYVRVDADNGDCATENNDNNSICNGIEAVTLMVGNNNGTSISTLDLPPICDTFEETGEINNPSYNDGIASGIDLTVLENQILSNLGEPSSNVRLLYYESLTKLENDIYPYGEEVISNPQDYTNIDEEGNPVEQVYVKVEFRDNAFCPTYVILNIDVQKGPEIFPEDVYYICPGGLVDIRLNIPEGINIDDYSFEWELPDGTITGDSYELLNSSEVGLYSIRITNNINNCYSPKFNFYVAEIDPPEIIELVVVDESIITIHATGYEDLPMEYSLNGIDFQESSTFTNLSPGVYTAWVRYIYNNRMCLGDPKSTILFKINNVLTPNGDGKNDCITVKDLHIFGDEKSTFSVYDRYGKEIFSEKSNTKIDWCGFYGGRVLPTTTYWYKLTIPDGREKTGHITLKNY